MELETLKSEIEAAVPGCRLEVILNPSPCAQHSLLVDPAHGLAIGLTTMFYGVVEIVAAFEVKHLPRRLAQTVRTVDGTSTRPLERATA